MKKGFLILLLTLPLLPSCNQHQHESASSAVQLDNGKRWQANPETTAGIAEMEATLDRYEGRTAEAADHLALRRELEASFQNIFKQCTMKGEAHNQLHNYLMPMEALFKKIDSADPAESQAAIGELRTRLGEYGMYFE